MRNWLAVGLLCGSGLLMAQWTKAPTYSPSAAPEYPASQASASTPDNADYESPDPADLQHAVARLSIIQGDVNVRRGDTGQLTGAIVNTPLLARDHVETSGGSRAEIQLDRGLFIRVASDTEVGFAALSYQQAQLQVGMGTIIFRILPGAAMPVEIDTPSVGIRALTQGEYRISVFDNGTSQITAQVGQLEISSPHGSEQLNSGHSVLVRGDASNPEMQNTAAPPRDQFDEWSQSLPSEAANPQSQQYVNADMQGVADLDRYGNWVPSGYGQVWRPQDVGADWSPYSDGQWSYVDYYGWSWIDYSPWGWAPYHYGRWFNNPGYGWCWWPGPPVHRAYWRPAMVGFFGFGGGLGWVALAPHERFYPWWGRGGYGMVNRGFGAASFHNASFRGGAFTSSYNSFGLPRQRFNIATRTQLSSATFISGRLPVTATRESYSFSNRTVSPNHRFNNAESRPFFNSAAARNAQPRTNSATPSGGWQHFGSPGVNSFRQNSNSENSGWHSFGNANRFQSAPRANSPAPSNSQPRGNYQTPYQRSAPQSSYQSRPSWQSAPRSFGQPSYQQQPRYSAPSAPRNNSAGGGNSRGGGGWSGGASPHSSGGGGGRPSGGGGGGGGHSGGGGGGGHRGR